MNSETNYTELANAIVNIAVKAGKAILEIYRQGDFGVEHKQDDSPLTQADLASHHCIVESLGGLTPGWNLLSEESADISWAERSGWQRYWLIDPLDGTKEFIKRNGEFTVNIALIQDQQPVLGVVHVPVQNCSYWGIRGVGAFRRQGEQEPVAIQTRATVASPLRVVGSRSHMSSRVQHYVEQMGQFDMLSMGSSLKFCLVAEGKADIYPRLGPTSEWDTAAAQAVVEAAGGQVIRTDGSPLRYNTRETLLNPEFLVIANHQRDWTAAVPPGTTHEDELLGKPG